MSAEIIPTVLVNKGDDFMERFNKVVGISNFVQIDFMDGKFVEQESTPLEEVPFLKEFDTRFEAHLMVQDPESWIEPLSKKGFTNVIFHYEALESSKDGIDVKYLAGLIRRYHMNPILAVNPETKVEEIFPVLDVINHVLVLGVHPGKEGQTFLADTLKRIKELKKKKPTLRIQVDGGVTLENAADISDAGCDFINSGSLIANSEIPKATLMKLQSEVDDISEEDGWE